MITEDFCSFEVSKLLQEKGFDGKCCYYYRCNDKAFLKYFANPGTLEDRFFCTNKWLKKHSNRNHCEYILAPTHYMAMKWLREEKHIEIHIAMSALNADGSREYMYDIFFTNERYSGKSITKAGFKTFEEAVEAALKYCLTEIL